MTLHAGRLLKLAMLALLMALCSCAKQDFTQEDSCVRKGMVNLDVKSGSDIDDYQFRFVGVGDYSKARTGYQRFGDVTFPMDCYSGNFKVQVQSCSRYEAETGYGKLRHEGLSESFWIYFGSLSSTSVSCSVSNIRVDLTYDNTILDLFDDFVLCVETVNAPVYDEDGALIKDRGTDPAFRTLEFTTMNKSGFFNLQNDPVEVSTNQDLNLKYTLKVKDFGEDEYQTELEGYFMDTLKVGTQVTDIVPRVLQAGDLVTLNFKYNGSSITSPGIKFIIDGTRTVVDNSISLPDYNSGSVEADD